jgi:uncharacterized membrane protein YtjA (UPF0391 family)
MFDWWFASLSGSTAHDIAAAAAWHGRLMVLAWSVLVPAALLWARYWKIAPKQDFPRVLDDKRWWHAHRGLQALAALVTLIAVALAWRGASTTGAWSAARLHHVLGWAAVALLCVQLVHGLMRGSKGGPTDAQMRGDHFDMTPRRVAFERMHKWCGWMAIKVAWGATLAGLWVADAPRWMVLLIVLWWLTLAALLTRWQRAGRCVDTYQTIWGTASDLPGLRRAPIGWGVRRYTNDKQPIDDSNSAARKKGIR